MSITEEDYHAAFEKYLVANEFKYTRQRKDIVEEVFSLHEHFEVENFIDGLRANNKQISRGTIYSTIKLLVQASLIRKIRTPNNQVFYEHTFGHEHHDHLICTECGKIIEINDPIIEQRQEEVCREMGFKQISHTHNVFGFCSDCQKGIYN